MTNAPTLEAWLELALVLGAEVALLVGAAALLDRVFRSAAWKRVLWQACLLGFPFLLLLEVTGASRGMVRLSESIFSAEIRRAPDPVTANGEVLFQVIAPELPPLPAAPPVAQGISGAERRRFASESEHVPANPREVREDPPPPAAALADAPPSGASAPEHA